ncbi:MAG TPA: histidine kinase [Syntrophomonadaceae bacterium]|nr:histidine kinase [Syntrophomonadaceae bacterium]
MRSLKEQFTLLVMGSIVLLTLSLMLAFYFQARSTAVMAAETKARSDLATAEAIIDLKYPGSWHVKDGVLYKGKVKINNNFFIVDYIEKLTGDTCTIFLDNVRVTTTIREKNGNRAVGTQASQEVTNKVLGARQEYVGEAEVVGKLYQTAYKPIMDEGGKVIGMLYVGAPRTLYRTILYGSLKIMGLAGFFCTLLIGAATWFFITRTVVEPLYEVIQGTRNAAVNRAGRPLVVQGSTEIWELTQAFNQMLSQIQVLTSRLSKVNNAPQQTEGVSESPLQEKLHGLGVLRLQVDRAGESHPLQQEDTQETGKEDRDGEWVESLLSVNSDLPKGLNRVTLKEVMLYMKQREGEEFTIQDVSEDLSLSKVTVRRYLDYLEQRGLVDVEQKYGSVGRPLRIYKFKT